MSKVIDSSIVGLTLYIDDLIVEVECDGTDPSHWGIKFVDVEAICLASLYVVTTECSNIISQISTKIFEINNFQEVVNVPNDTPELEIH